MLNNAHASDREDGTRKFANRATLSLSCEVRQATRPWKVTRLEDLSPDGFRMAWLPGCHPDLPLKIRIPGMQVLTAHIRWKKEGSVGCEFKEQLYPAVFDHLARQADG